MNKWKKCRDWWSEKCNARKREQQEWGHAGGLELTTAGGKQWKRSGWREGEGQWGRARMREMGGGEVQKEKSRSGNGQGENKKFHNQSAVRTCCDGYMGTAVLIQQPSIDKYCYWQSPRDYIYTSASLEISKNVQPKLVGPQLVIPGRGTAGRDTMTRGEYSLMGWKMWSSAFRDKVTVAWKVALVNSDWELLLSGWLFNCFTQKKVTVIVYLGESQRDLTKSTS